MKKIVGSTLDLSTKAVFSFEQVPIEKYGLKTPFLLFNIYKNRKSFTEVLSPPWPN